MLNVVRGLCALVPAVVPLLPSLDGAAPHIFPINSNEHADVTVQRLVTALLQTRAETVGHAALGDARVETAFHALCAVARRHPRAVIARLTGAAGLIHGATLLRADEFCAQGHARTFAYVLRLLDIVRTTLFDTCNVDRVEAILAPFTDLAHVVATDSACDGRLIELMTHWVTLLRHFLAAQPDAATTYLTQLGHVLAGLAAGCPGTGVDVLVFALEERHPALARLSPTTTLPTVVHPHPRQALSPKVDVSEAQAGVCAALAEALARARTDPTSLRYVGAGSDS